MATESFAWPAAPSAWPAAPSTAVAAYLGFPWRLLRRALDPLRQIELAETSLHFRGTVPVHHDYDAVLRLRPGLARAHFNRGNCLARLGQRGAASDTHAHRPDHSRRGHLACTHSITRRRRSGHVARALVTFRMLRVQLL